jgi:mannose-6-phosphate isomerase-like protein (cupin superfamily)
MIEIPAGGGEILGDAPDRRVEALSDHAAMCATWTRFGPGRDGAELHIHYEHTDLFYVLDGELTVQLGLEATETTVPVGELVRIPPGVVHGFRNAADRELRFVNLHVPGVQFIDYMRGIRDGEPFPFDQHEPPADGGRPTDEVSIGEPQVDLPNLQIDVVDGGEQHGFASLYEIDAGTFVQLDAGESRTLPPGRYLRVRHADSSRSKNER